MHFFGVEQFKVAWFEIDSAQSQHKVRSEIEGNYDEKTKKYANGDELTVVVLSFNGLRSVEPSKEKKS